VDVADRSGQEAIDRGDLIAAYDRAASAIADGDQSASIRHQQVLALAGMGDTEGAMRLYESYGLDRSVDPHHRAAGARLLKDRALAAPDGEGRQARLEAAYSAYRAIYEQSGDPYPGVNAASLAMLAGRPGEAAALAQALLADPVVAEPAEYYSGATAAEALLLLGRNEDGAAMLRRTAALDGGSHFARSTTCRQLARIARATGIDDQAVEELLAPIRPLAVVHYCGHMFAAEPEAEARIRASIEEALDRHRIGFAYGSLASGADVLLAEALLALGGELHLVFPFAESDFIAQSVLPAGETWLPRYRACLEAAASKRWASEMHYVGDPEQFAFASHVAMGLARLHAQRLGGDPLQLAIWDGKPSGGPAGTGTDVGAWRARGGRSEVVDPGAIDRGFVRPPAQEAIRERRLAAILFTDFAGFSKLTEAALPAFWDGVMGTVAGVLDRHGEQVLARNSWGDALYAVMPTAVAAARIALELQEALGRFDYSRLGLDLPGGGMRIGVHYGSVYKAEDPISGRPTFYGSEVSRAARVEPVTPPGAVFVTEPFAAILALEEPDAFRCNYVGRIDLAKGYGTFPMYRLAAERRALS
jgi:class 3 adenylate cyclase